VIYKDKVLLTLFTEHIQLLRLNLKEAMFEGAEKQIFTHAMQFYSAYTTPITRDVMLKYSEDKSSPVQKEIEEILNRVIKGEPQCTKADAALWMEKFVEEFKDHYVKTLLQEASSVNYEKGSKSAIEKINKEISNLLIQIDDGTISVPLHIAVDRMKDRLEYLAANPEEAYGILTQFDLIDNITNGGRNKDYWTIAAYTGHGKTALLCNMAYTTAYVEKKNCVFVTKEMGESEINDRLALICACREFGTVIDSKSFEIGELTLEQRECLYDGVFPFLKSNDRGHLEVFQVPPGYTVADLNNKLHGLHNVIEGGLDAVFVDGITLLASTKKRNDARTDIDQIIIDSRDASLNFAEGRGVWWVNTHQINAEGYKFAQKEGHYNLTHLSVTREMERSSTFIMWLFATRDDVLRNTVKAGILKNRKGDCFVPPEYLMAFWPCYTFLNREEPAKLDEIQSGEYEIGG